MTDVLRSMIRFSWAMSLFGARQAVEMLSAVGTARSLRQVSTGFDAVSDAAQDQLGNGLAETYRAGDRWQQVMVDAVFGALDPAVDLSRNLASKTLLRGSLAVLRRSAIILESAMPGGGVVWRELGNKLEAFESFQYVDQILGFENLDAASLLEQVTAAEGNGPYLRLWLTEGLGFAFTEAAWDDGEPRELLRRPALEELPAESLIPLHTGMGLALARHLLPELSGDRQAVREALRRFEELCVHNARDGFALASYEALGLVVRQLAPEAVAEVDRVLSRAVEAEAERGAFWHGFGRGLYFVATQTLPGSSGRAVAKARREAPAGPPRLNALSGLAWALTLVNFRQPEILESFLREQRFAGAEREAVAAGVASAVVLWRDAAGDESHLEAFRGHRPSGGSASLWGETVTAPCTQALADWQSPKSRLAPGEIFYYR